MSDEAGFNFAHVDQARRILRTGGEKMLAAGVAEEDVALGVLYAVFDLVELSKGEGLGAIEWMRSGLDVIERSVLDGNARMTADGKPWRPN